MTNRNRNRRPNPMITLINDMIRDSNLRANANWKGWY